MRTRKNVYRGGLNKSLRSRYTVMGRARVQDKAFVDNNINMLNRLHKRKGGKKKKRQTKKRDAKIRGSNYNKRMVALLKKTKNHWGVNRGKGKGCFKVCIASSFR